MAVRIRLQRVGKKNRPSYRVAVVDSRFPRDGRFIEIVGNYDPLKHGDNNLVLKVDRIQYWVSKGAQMSERVGSFMRRYKPPALSANATAPAGAQAAPAVEAQPAPKPRAADKPAKAEKPAKPAAKKPAK